MGESQLYLVSPVLETFDGFAALIEPCLAASPVAAMLLRFASLPDVETLRPFVSRIQERGVAVLAEGSVGSDTRFGWDGLHCSHPSALSLLPPEQKSSLQIGCGGLKSRHDAMVAGEQGVDYVLFGDPFDHFSADYRESLNLVVWWREMFELPCVAYAHSAEQMKAAADVRPDFIAVGPWAYRTMQDFKDVSAFVG